MRRPDTFRRALGASLLLLAFAGVGLARTSSPESYVDEKTRNIVGGRKVLVVLASPQIEAGFDRLSLSPAIVVFGFAGYRLGLDQMNRELAEAATPRVLPLRQALNGYDFNTLLYDALVPVLQGSSWLRGQDYERSGDGASRAIEQHLNDSNTRQMFVLDGHYYVDHHRQAICVEITATILIRKIPKGQHSEARLDPDYIPYRQTFRSVTYLPGSEGASAEQVIARWSANDARFARRALDQGIERVRTLLAENIDATREGIEPWRHRGERKTVERYDMQGWVVAREADAVRFCEARTGTLNYIQTMSTD